MHLASIIIVTLRNLITMSANFKKNSSEAFKIKLAEYMYTHFIRETLSVVLRV